MHMARLLLLVTFGALAGCGHADPATAAPTAQAPQASPMPPEGASDGSTAAPTYHCDFDAPLSADDVRLYLSVMREASAMVQHPTAADIAERKRVNAAASPDSIPPAQTPAEEAESDRVSMMDNGMADNVIVDQRHIDQHRWGCISRKVEDAIPPPGEVVGDGDPDYQESAEERANEARVERRIAANKAILAANSEEIRALEKVVRAYPSARAQP